MGTRELVKTVIRDLITGVYWERGTGEQEATGEE